MIRLSGWVLAFALVAHGAQAENQCAQPPITDEAVAIRQTAGKVERDGETLTIRTQTGTITLRTNYRSEGHSDSYYAKPIFVGQPTRNLYLIEIQLYEGGYYKLINHDSGQTYDIAAFPWFSPNGSRFIVHSGLYGHESETLEVWAVEKGQIAPLWVEPLMADYAAHTSQWLRERGTPEGLQIFTGPLYCFTRWLDEERAFMQGFDEPNAKTFPERDYEAGYDVLLVYDGHRWGLTKVTP